MSGFPCKVGGREFRLKQFPSAPTEEGYSSGGGLMGAKEGTIVQGDYNTVLYTSGNWWGCSRPRVSRVSSTAHDQTDKQRICVRRFDDASIDMGCRRMCHSSICAR